MCKSAFRPSDDSSLFPFFVPANAMAVVELRHVGQLLQAFASLPQAEAQADEYRGLADAASALADELDLGIRTYAVVPVPTWTRQALELEADAMMFAYEVRLLLTLRCLIVAYPFPMSSSPLTL